MGTSAGYGLPTSGNWPDFKRDLSSLASLASSGQTEPIHIGRTMGKYAEAHGGARQAAQQMSSASRTGAKLGGFLTGAQQAGLSQALEAEGLGELIGQTPTRVFRGLADHFIGNGSVLEDDIVREALLELRLELFGKCDTYPDLEMSLSELLQSDGVDSVIRRFFGMCIYKRFETHSTERLLKQVSGGVRAVKRLLREIKNYIFAKLDVRTHGREFTDVDWRGAEGENISQDILASVWRVYGEDL